MPQTKEGYCQWRWNGTKWVLDQTKCKGAGKVCKHQNPPTFSAAVVGTLYIRQCK